MFRLILKNTQQEKRSDLAVKYWDFGLMQQIILEVY